MFGTNLSLKFLLIFSLMVVVCISSCKKQSPGGSSDDSLPKTDVDSGSKPPVPQNEAVDDKTEGSREIVSTDIKSAELVPLPIKLPTAVFRGTPQPTNVPNLEKPLGKDRPPFLAPAGAVNLAAGKNVTGSDEEPIMGDLEMITDGDKEAPDGSYVELGPFLQYITIDLEQQCEIYATLLWHYHKEAVVYFDVVVQISNDPDFVMDVITVFNNDLDNSAGLGVGKDKHYVETNEGKLIDCRGVQGRYVRLYSQGSSYSDLNHYIEVEVFGKPIQ